MVLLTTYFCAALRLAAIGFSSGWCGQKAAISS